MQRAARGIAAAALPMVARVVLLPLLMSRAFAGMLLLAASAAAQELPTCATTTTTTTTCTGMPAAAAPSAWPVWALVRLHGPDVGASTQRRCDQALEGYGVRPELAELRAHYLFGGDGNRLLVLRHGQVVVEERPPRWYVEQLCHHAVARMLQVAAGEPSLSASSDGVAEIAAELQVVGEGLQKIGDHEGALRELLRAYELAPTVPLALLVGGEYERADSPRQAVELYLRPLDDEGPMRSVLARRIARLRGTGKTRRGWIAVVPIVGSLLAAGATAGVIVSSRPTIGPGPTEEPPRSSGGGLF